MRTNLKNLLMVTVVLCVLTNLADAMPKSVFFRATFDGNADAMLQGQPTSPVESQKLQYEASDQSKALIVGAGTTVRYNMGATYPSKAGAFAVRFKPNFPQTAKSPARVVMSIKRNGVYQVELSFSPKGLRWILTVKGRKWRKELILWHGRVKEKQWNHMLFVWDKTEKKFSIYHQGKWVGTINHDNRYAGPGVLEIGGEHDAGISVDEVVLYNRAFTHKQAKLLNDTFKTKGDRFDTITKRLAADDKALAERRALIAKLNGKVGMVYHNRGRKAKKGEYASEGVTYTSIRPEDIGKIDLSQYSVIHFPMGPKFQIKPEQYKYIVEYVKNGGGYVGSCQGSLFAEKLKLLDFKCYSMDVWGLYNIVIKKQPHVVLGGRKGVIRMHHGNGPIMVAGKGCEVHATYLLGFPTGEPAAILSGKCGKGTVVLFGTHPRGEKVSYKGARAYFSGKLMETQKMFTNSLLYAAGLVDSQGRPTEASADK
jgi:Concanavalin A-like lectin/glucanases superfamily